MKTGDYQTTNQARDYQQRRFGNGLSLVSGDETSLLKCWLELISTSKLNLYLDLGCGTGRITGELLKRRPQVVYALDTSATMLSLLERTYAQDLKKQKLKTLNAPSDKIPLETGSIELITAFHLFKHLPDINSTLKEAYRVLRPGGYLIFDVLNNVSLVRLHLGSCHALSETSIKDKLGKNGFKIIKMSPLNIFGETAYNFPIPILIHAMDNFFSKIVPKLATKFFILAQKL